MHKNVLGWTIADWKGISPLICTHKIYLEENAKLSREMQWRLNPNMKEVVKNEVITLLDNGIIYLISNSKWVSPTQVVPKKSGVIVITNKKNELIPIRNITGWRTCIDYRKLNSMTRKDHFPLPFIAPSRWSGDPRLISGFCFWIKELPPSILVTRNPH